MSAPRPGTRPKPLPLGSSSHCGPGLDLPSWGLQEAPTVSRCRQGPRAPQHPVSPWSQQGRPLSPQGAGSLRNHPQQPQEAPSLTSLGSKARSWEAPSRVVWAPTLPSCNSPSWQPAHGSLCVLVLLAPAPPPPSPLSAPQATLPASDFSLCRRRPSVLIVKRSL